jgi:hypothetical protein
MPFTEESPRSPLSALTPQSRTARFSSGLLMTVATMVSEGLKVTPRFT